MLGGAGRGAGPPGPLPPVGGPVPAAAPPRWLHENTRPRRRGALPPPRALIKKSWESRKGAPKDPELQRRCTLEKTALIIDLGPSLEALVSGLRRAQKPSLETEKPQFLSETPDSFAGLEQLSITSSATFTSFLG